MLSTIFTKLLTWWHSMLNLATHSPPSWYVDRLVAEEAEVLAASTLLLRLSEKSDVLFSISRAQYDGFPIPDRSRPPFNVNTAPVYAYMIGKYTSRWAFYRTVAFLAGAKNWKDVNEVVNPNKARKLAVVARRHGIGAPGKFVKVGSRLRRVWLLIP